VIVTNTVLPWLVGRYTTGRSGYIDEVERQAEAERRAARDAIMEVVTDEREAFARDLHDTISHHVSAVGVHAAAARLCLPSPVIESPEREQVVVVEEEETRELNRSYGCRPGLTRYGVGSPVMGRS
jgi:signal transduction histidine kinase